MAYESTQYPTGADLIAFIMAAGIDIPPGFTGDAEMASVIAEWESRTSWYPYLAGAVETRLYDPPGSGPHVGRVTSANGGRILSLGAGIVNMPDNGLSIGVIASTLNQIGINSQNTGSLGTVLTRDIQYFLRPNNAPYMHRPWTEIEFLAPIRGLPKSIAITAQWGRTLIIEPDVWYGLLQRGFTTARPILSMYTSGGANRITDEHSSVSFDGGVFSTETSQIDRLFNALVTRRKRMSV